MKKLDIHSCLASEAEIKIKSFLLECFNHRQYFGLIIHGFGKKILMNLTRRMCNESKYVSYIEIAPPQIGGAGATLVYFKKRGVDGKIISN